MSKTEQIVSEIAEPIAAEIGARVYDVEYKKEGDWVLRIYLYKEKGITIDDCEYVSRKLSDILDEKEPIKTAYMLEVSSPGIERVLKYDWHFETAIGEEVFVKLFKEVIGSKKHTGVLRSFDDATVTLDIDGEKVVFEREEISNIRLSYRSDWKNE